MGKRYACILNRRGKKIEITKLLENENEIMREDSRKCYGCIVRSKKAG
jgi:hypothetical protein